MLHPIVILAIASVLRAEICTRPSFRHTHVEPFSDQFLTVPLRSEVISGCLDAAQYPHLKEARSIRIVNQTVPSLYEQAVNNLPELSLLILDENQIEVVHPGAFNNLPSLETLSLKKNNLKEIRSGVFNYLPVSKLYLSKNQIAHIDANAFDHMPNLAMIVLTNNSIATWDSNWFKDSPQVTSIFMSRNHLTEIPAGAFKNIRGRHFFANQIYLTNIYLNQNDIERIAPGAFDNLEMLETLDLEGNQLSLLDNDVFASLRNIRKLILKNNRLVCLPFNLPDVINRADDVSYDYNPIDPLCIDSFRTRMNEKIRRS